MFSLLVPPAAAQQSVRNLLYEDSPPRYTTLDLFDADGATEGQPSGVYRHELIAQYPKYLGCSSAIMAWDCADAPRDGIKLKLGADVDKAAVLAALEEQLRPFIRLLLRISPSAMYLGPSSADDTCEGSRVRARIVASFFAGFNLVRKVLAPELIVTAAAKARSEVAGAVIHRALVAVLGLSVCRNTAELHNLLLAEMARAEPFVWACQRCFAEFDWLERASGGNHRVNIEPQGKRGRWGSVYVDDATAADVLCESELSAKLTSAAPPARAVELAGIAKIERVHDDAREGKEADAPPRRDGARAAEPPAAAPAVSVFDEIAGVGGGAAADEFSGASGVAATVEPTSPSGNVFFADGLLSLEVQDGIAELRVLPGDAIALCTAGAREQSNSCNIVFFAPPKEAKQAMDRLARLALHEYYDGAFYRKAVEGDQGAAIETMFDSHEAAWQYLCHTKESCSVVLLGQGVMLRRDELVPDLQWRVCFNTARDSVDSLPFDALIVLAADMGINLSAYKRIHDFVLPVAQLAMRVARDACVGATDGIVQNESIVPWFKAYRRVAPRGAVAATGAACRAVAHALCMLAGSGVPKPREPAGVVEFLKRNSGSEGTAHLIKYVESSDTAMRSSELLRQIRVLSDAACMSTLKSLADCNFYNTTLSLFPLAAVLSPHFLARSRCARCTRAQVRTCME